MSPRTKPNTQKQPTAPRIAAWEEEEICLWLALTDSIRETARTCGRAASTVWEINQRRADHIIRLRAEMSLDLRNQFDATIRVVQAKIRELVGQIKGKEDALALADPLFTLSKTVAIQTERRQVISELPGTINREEGGGGDQEKEADKLYLRQLLDELRESRV